MKRSELSLAALGLILLAWGAAWIHAARGPMRGVTLDGGPACPAAPVRILEPASNPPRGFVVIFHGLGANRIVMLTNGQQFAAAGFRVFLPDAPGHGDDTAPFSFAAYQSCARGLLATFQQRGEISPQRTILLGHSLGAAVAVRLADDFPAAATIAVATAPLVPPHRIPANLLLVAPQFDMPAVRDTESRLASAGGADRAALEDFRQLRAFRLLVVRWRSHTGALFDSAAARAMLRWALEAVGAASAPVPVPNYRAFNGGWIGLLGVLLLFPATASVVARLAGFQRPLASQPPPQPGISLLAWIATLIPAAILAARWPLFSLLHQYSADYLCSVLFIAGVPLALGYGVYAARQRRSDSSLGSSSSPLAGPIYGALMGLLAIAAVGAWLNLQITESWPIPARWERFPFLLLALLPICYAEEHALGDPTAPSALARPGRFTLFVAVRAIVWLVALGAWLSGVSSALLVTILVAFLAALSLAQRLGADALRRRTASPLSAAIFNAILGAWFLAAAFPLA
jgi:pimeloyl-ACP methyl ester carboxylesterase